MMNLPGHRTQAWQGRRRKCTSATAPRPGEAQVGTAPRPGEAQVGNALLAFCSCEARKGIFYGDVLRPSRMVAAGVHLYSAHSKKWWRRSFQQTVYLTCPVLAVRHGQFSGWSPVSDRAEPAWLDRRPVPTVRPCRHSPLAAPSPASALEVGLNRHLYSKPGAIEHRRGDRAEPHLRTGG